MSVIAAAGSAQGLKMAFQQLQRLYLLFNFRDMLFNEKIYPVTGGGGGIPESEQGADLSEAHAVLAASAYEMQALHVGLRIEAIARIGAFGLAQKSFFFVVAYGHDLRVRGFGEVTYFQGHGYLLAEFKSRVAIGCAESRCFRDGKIGKVS
jgi:hypothetical protein